MHVALEWTLQLDAHSGWNSLKHALSAQTFVPHCASQLGAACHCVGNPTELSPCTQLWHVLVWWAASWCLALKRLVCNSSLLQSYELSVV